MSSPNVDLDALTHAFTDSSLERSYYLDLETGRVFNLLEDHNDPETEEIQWQIEADGGRRYAQIPKLSLEEEMQEQDTFVESLDDAELKAKLTEVLEKDRDGSHFNDFVTRDRKARDKWRVFWKDRSRQRADQWLDKLGLNSM